MANLLLVLCVLATIFKSCLAANCGVNEQWTACPSPCAVYSPTNEASLADEESCSPEECLADACTCLFNHRRLENGTCVPTQQCPPIDCKPNEYYALCPPLCPTDDCSSATRDGQCVQLPFIIQIVLPCTPRCRCAKGYWRKNGVCVPYEKC